MTGANRAEEREGSGPIHSLSVPVHLMMRHALILLLTLGCSAQTPVSESPRADSRPRLFGSGDTLLRYVILGDSTAVAVGGDYENGLAVGSARHLAARRRVELVNVAVSAIPELVKFVRDNEIGLTVVGPEAPLAAGIVDAFRAADLPIFGPTRAAAQLERSKDFAKAFMARHGLPTAAYRTFTDAAAAHAYVAERGAPIVI